MLLFHLINEKYSAPLFAYVLPPAHLIDTTGPSTLPMRISFRILEKTFHVPFPTAIPIDEVRAALEFIISGTLLL